MLPPWRSCLEGVGATHAGPQPQMQAAFDVAAQGRGRPHAMTSSCRGTYNAGAARAVPLVHPPGCGASLPSGPTSWDRPCPPKQEQSKDAFRAGRLPTSQQVAADVDTLERKQLAGRTWVDGSARPVNKTDRTTESSSASSMAIQDVSSMLLLPWTAPRPCSRRGALLSIGAETPRGGLGNAEHNATGGHAISGTA